MATRDANTQTVERPAPPPRDELLGEEAQHGSEEQLRQTHDGDEQAEDPIPADETGRLMMQRITSPEKRLYDVENCNPGIITDRGLLHQGETLQCTMAMQDVKNTSLRLLPFRILNMNIENSIRRCKTLKHHLNRWLSLRDRM